MSEPAQHLEPGRDHLDLTRRQVRVGVSLGSQGDLTDDLEAVLVPQLVRPGGRQHLIPHDHLHHTGGVAQIEERHPAVVSPAGDPSGQRDLGSSLLGAQPAGIVGADQRASISTSTNLTSYGPTTFSPP